MIAIFNQTEHKFTFGLWTVGVQEEINLPQQTHPTINVPADLVRLLGEVGAYGVNFHDNDLTQSMPPRLKLKRSRKSSKLH